MNYQIVIDDVLTDYTFSKRDFRSALEEYKDTPVTVRVSSPGGSLDHGLDIYQQIRDHGDVTVYITGFTASAATVLAMGAKKIVMSRSALFLVHKCMYPVDVFGHMNADELREIISNLTDVTENNDKVDLVLAGIYAEKTGRPIAEMLDLMTTAPLMTAEEALEAGLVDELADIAETDAGTLSDVMTNKFIALGYNIPRPAAATANPTPRDRSTTFNIGSLLSRIFHKPDEMNQPEFTNIAGAISGFSVSGSGDNLTVSAAALGQLDTLLGERTAEVSRLQEEQTANAARIAELETQLAAALEIPGDTSEPVDDTAGAEERPTAADLFNSVKSVL